MYKTKEQAYRQLNFDLVVARADKLLEQRNELLEQLYGSIPLPHSKVTQEDYSAGHIQVGDVIGYDRSNKRIRFGTVSKLNKAGVIWLTHSYCVVFGDDGKQEIYQSMDGSIEGYRVCKVL